MAILKRGNAWYWEFMKGGKRFRGTCEGCKTEKQAYAYLQKMKEKQAATATARNVEQLYEIRHEELTGNTGIALADAFAESLKYSVRKIAPARLELKRKVFADFVAFLKSTHPEIKNISEVREEHAKEYHTRLINKGRFISDVVYMRNGREITTVCNDRKLANNTVNYYILVCGEVFDKLKSVAGIIHNPFAQCRRLPKQEEEREVFTDEEIKLIYEKANDFVRPLFTVAFDTGMREGDICTLKWSQVDLKEGKIRKGQNKTKYKVEIPIMPSLQKYLEEQHRITGGGEYVFPEHAKIYTANKSGVSYRIKEFLEGIGIKTTRIPEGRTRAVSIKDLHSCRHTFAKRAADAGVGLVTVKSLLGHMTEGMTEHYSSHATFKDKQKAMAKISDSTDTRRLEILDRLSKLPTDTLEKLLKRL